MHSINDSLLMPDVRVNSRFTDLLLLTAERVIVRIFTLRNDYRPRQSCMITDRGKADICLFYLISSNQNTIEIM